MKKFKILILAAAALLCTLSAAAETGSTLVFNTGLSNGNGDTSKYWRIPAIVRTGDGRLLAVADDRGNNNYKDPGSLEEKVNEAIAECTDELDKQINRFDTYQNIL